MKSRFALITAVAVLGFIFLANDANAGELPDKAAQVIVLKLDDAIAHKSPSGPPVSPRWQRITDFLRASNIKASYGIIDYLRSKRCLLTTPSEYMAKATGDGDGEDAGWTSLFNGRNLDGWVIKCLPKDEDKRDYWKVVDGTITAETPAGGKHNYIWLLTEKEYGDFELRMKVQTYASSTGNSGIQVRSRYDDEAGWLDGPQVDVNPPGPWRCGFIYDETREAKVWLWPDVGRPANAKPEHAPEGWKWFHADDRDIWNDVHIVCSGTRIKTIVNGVTVADYDGAGRLDDRAHLSHNVGLKGHIGLQIHPGKQMLIRFKDVEVRESE